MLQVLAYGQTGSGKTYSMGSTAAPQQLNGSSKPYGVIPRALVTLFEGLQQLQADYEVASKVSADHKGCGPEGMIATKVPRLSGAQNFLSGCLLGFGKVA